MGLIEKDVKLNDLFMLGFILTRIAVTLELQAYSGLHEVDPEFRKTLSKAVDTALEPLTVVFAVSAALCSADCLKPLK